MTVPKKTLRNEYTGSGNSSGPFDFDWRIFAEDQLGVFELDDQGNESKLTLNSDYVVSGIGQDTGGHIDLEDGNGNSRNLPNNHKLVIIPEVDIVQETDFTNQGGFFPDQHEKSFDFLTIAQKQIQELLDRTVRINVTSSADASTIDPEDVEDVASISSEVTTVAGISSNVTTVAGISSDVTTTAGIEGDIKTLADIEDGTDNTNAIQTVADIEDGTNATNAVQTVAGISGDVTTAASNSTDISTVATNITNVNNVGSNITDVQTVAGSISDVESASNALASAFKYTFDNNTGMADPGVGELRFDNGTLSSVSNIAIDAQTAQSGNPDVSDFIATWDDSTNPVTGQLRVIKGGDPGTFVLFDVTGVTDNTDWLQISVNYLDSNGSFSNGDTLYISYTRTGDKGAAFQSSDITSQSQTALASDDQIVATDTSNGDALIKNTVQGLYDAIDALSSTSNVDNANDYIPVYDSSGGSAKKVAPSIIQPQKGLFPLSTYNGNNNDANFTNLPQNRKAIYFHCAGIVNSGGNNLIMRTSSDNGSTFDSGTSDYSYAFENLEDGNTNNNETSTGNDKISIANIDNDNGGNFNGWICLHDPGNTGLMTHITVFGSINVPIDEDTMSIKGSATRRELNNVDALKITFASGSIASGEITAYELIS